MTSVALARYVDHHTLGHASGDVDFHHFLAFGDTGAAAVLTFVLDHLALAVTCGTNALSLHHAKDALGGVGDDTRTVTCGAGLAATVALGTRTVTVSAGDVFSHLELLGDARIDFLESQSHLQAQVAASVYLRATTASTTEATSEAVSAEDIAKHREDIIHVHRCSAEAIEASAEATAHRTVESKLIVLLALLWVVQHVVGLCSLLKLLLGLLVARIAVGVIFDGYLSVCLLDFVFRGRLADAQHLVVVSFLCHFIVLRLLLRSGLLCRSVYSRWPCSQSPCPSCRHPCQAPER